MDDSTPYTPDTRLDNAQEDPAAFLLLMIETLYNRPEAYVQRLGELNSLLYFTHFLWAHIAGQTSHYIRMGGWSFPELNGYTELTSLLESDHNTYSGAMDFAPVVNFWRSVDTHIGIDPVT